MKVTMSITCNCGSSTSVDLIRETEDIDGRVYEDSLLIGETFEKDKKFDVKLAHDQTSIIHCHSCNNKLELSL